MKRSDALVIARDICARVRENRKQKLEDLLNSENFTKSSQFFEVQKKLEEIQSLQIQIEEGVKRLSSKIKDATMNSSGTNTVSVDVYGFYNGKENVRSCFSVRVIDLNEDQVTQKIMLDDLKGKIGDSLDSYIQTVVDELS